MLLFIATMPREVASASISIAVGVIDDEFIERTVRGALDAAG